MCILSNIGDGYRDTFPQRWPNVVPSDHSWTGQTVDLSGFVTKAELDTLRAEVQELRVLLTAAKRFDEATGQPDCEADEKVAFIKGLADLLGVDMSEVFG